MAFIKRYTIGKNRLKRSFIHGFRIEENGTLVFQKNIVCHYLFLRKLDSGNPDTVWGRLCMEGEIPRDCILRVYGYADNETGVEMAGEDSCKDLDEFFMDQRVSLEKKKGFHCLVSVNHKDILFYRLRGRYLWICIEIEGKGDGRLENLCFYQPGNHFMATFPDIYQENASIKDTSGEAGDFFHRFLSIFSSIYMDLGYGIDSMKGIPDLHTAPESLLPVFGKWLGLDFKADHFGEACYRELLLALYELNKYRGTKQAIRRIIRILLKEEAVIVERVKLEEYLVNEERDIYDYLFGKSNLGFTVLIKRELEEALKIPLLHLLHQYKPVRSKMQIIYLKEQGVLDNFCFFNINAKIVKHQGAEIDVEHTMNEGFVLK